MVAANATDGASVATSPLLVTYCRPVGSPGRRRAPRAPRDWLTEGHRADFGTRRKVDWLPVDPTDVAGRGERDAAREQFDISLLVRDLIDLKRAATKAGVARSVGLSITHLNQILRGETHLQPRHRCALGIELDFPASLELDIDEYLEHLRGR